MARKNLTDRALKALRPAPDGKPYDVMDAGVPGLGVRVLAGGQRTFVLVARFPGCKNPTRRALGSYGELTLEKAREKARGWHELIRRGTDPQAEEDRAVREQDRRRANSFRAVAEDFFRLALIGPNSAKPKQRKGPVVKREIEREFIARWGARPITEISPDDVIAVIDAAVARGAEYQAHNLLGHVRRLFNWAIARRVYGLDHSPCDRMKPKEIIGQKALRTRVLNDLELRTFWLTTKTIPYPYGPLFRLLLLTGQRKTEVAEMQRAEIDLPTKLWTIPAERMKMDHPHVVPLSDDAVAVLETLPRFNKGEYLFSTTFGDKPVNGFSKAKSRLDKLMLAELAKAGVAATLKPFVLHDIRRTVRTRMSGLPISSDVAELVISHARPGLRKVYDQYGYLEEKRDALTLWARALNQILNLKQAAVVSLRARQHA